MRVKVIGESECARAVRGLLRKAGFAVTEFLPADALLNGPLAGYVVYVEEGPAESYIYFDSTDSELEANIVRHIAALSPLPVTLDRPGGKIHSDREICIVVPERASGLQIAVELGVMRGLLDTVASGERASSVPRRGFWRRLFHFSRRKL